MNKIYKISPDQLEQNNIATQCAVSNNYYYKITFFTYVWHYCIAGIIHHDVFNTIWNHTIEDMVITASLARLNTATIWWHCVPATPGKNFFMCSCKNK